MGSDAVVMTGTFISLANFASVVVLVRVRPRGLLDCLEQARLVIEQEHDGIRRIEQRLRPWVFLDLGWACEGLASRNPDRQDRG